MGPRLKCRLKVGYRVYQGCLFLPRFQGISSPVVFDFRLLFLLSYSSCRNRTDQFLPSHFVCSALWLFYLIVPASFLSPLGAFHPRSYWLYLHPPLHLTHFKVFPHFVGSPFFMPLTSSLKRFLGHFSAFIKYFINKIIQFLLFYQLKLHGIFMKK